MTLFDLLQKANEENENNIAYAKSLKSLKESIEKTKQNKKWVLFQQWTNGELSTPIYQEHLKTISQEALSATKQIEALYAPKSKFNEMLARLKDCGAFISNKMMCNLLKTQTGTNWTYSIVEENPYVARLYFKNDLYEKYTAQQGILSQAGNLEYVIKKLENINWFQQYLNAKHFCSGELLEMSLVTGQKGFIFAPFIQITLEEFFKHIQINPEHPEQMSLDEHKFDAKPAYVPQKRRNAKQKAKTFEKNER